MLNKSYLFLLSFCFAATAAQAQKMNVLDYFKAFVTNTKSPNNQLAGAKNELSVTNISANEYKILYYPNQKNYSIAILDAKNNFLTYKKDFNEGWGGGECYPTFKVYTRADGKQVLGVTEDSYTHHNYRSKYSYSAPTLDSDDMPNYESDMDALDEDYDDGKITSADYKAKKEALKSKAQDYLAQNDPYRLWNARPRPIKFWTYEGGTWTEVTDQVMSEFFSLEQMVAKTTATPAAGLTVSQHISENITHHIYPLYRIEQDKNEITVWVDEARLRLFTTEIEEFANAADNLTSRKTGLTKHLFNFIENTTYKTYTLVWDDKAGKFVRKK